MINDTSTSSIKKYGILGGTFNPIHLGHLELAKGAQRQFELDKVFVMPNSIPDYKDVDSSVSTAHRVNMIRLAIDGCEGLEYSDFELRRSGITYTSDTLAELCGFYPDVHWYFIMGGDSIMYFDKWHLPETIMRLSTLLVSCRGSVTEGAIRDKIAHLRTACLYADIRLLSADIPDVSSSAIRQAASDGYSIHGMVPESVEKYIADNRLYIPV